MQQITAEQLKNAIHSFLQKELEAELGIEIAKLKNPTEKTIENRRLKLKDKYNYNLFLEGFISSAIFFKEQELSLGTHTSKGINSLVKSNNTIFKPTSNISFVGHQSLSMPYLDASSNNTGNHAGHLKNIVDFLNIPIENKRFYQLFSEYSEEFNEIFNLKEKDSILFIENNLLKSSSESKTDERNKQLLHPVKQDDYVCLIPLYPSSLAYFLFENLINYRFSSSVKKSRQARRNKKLEQPYKEFLNLAYVRLGGDNSQNVSRLNNKQNGRNYLLPSLPPQFKQSQQFKIYPSAESIFSRNLEYRCGDVLQALYRLIKTNYNNVDIRNARKDILDSLLYRVLAVATSIQEDYPASWSKDYSLNINEKFWLDPQRADQDEAFAEQKQTTTWQAEISQRFANWVNYLLRKELKAAKHEIADAEHLEWQQEMQELIKQTQRQGMEIFQ